ncbi:MAG: glucose-6-phosphate isomerase [Planctomycetota bacterium]|nr:glucose-6-phosphate isomerase [Planctomycetota bacterium]
MATVTIDYKNVTSNAVGPEHGLTEQELSVRLKRSGRLLEEMASERATGGLAFLDLPRQEGTVEAIGRFVERKLDGIENFVVLGIGGSALGAKAVYSALLPPFYNLLPKKKRGKSPRVFVLDNVDPEETGALMNLLSPKETMFNVVTKSGETTETLAAMLSAVELLKKAVGDRWRDHVVLTTDPEKGFLRQLARRENLATFDVPPRVGGRFSVLTPVGLLPAAAAGINIKEVLAGAGAMDSLCSSAAPAENPACVCAVINYLMDTAKHKNVLATMPYAYALKDLAEWFRQLWAESLGKKLSLEKKVVNVGSTPVTAVGATDQHSQLQLFNEGPHDKLIVFLEVESFRNEVNLPALFPEDENTAFLGGKKLSHLIRSEKRGTELSLLESRRPNYTIMFSEVSPRIVGAFIMLFEFMTAVAGKLYNVNTFDQPGVAESKVATFALMGRKGYESRTEDMLAKVNGVAPEGNTVRCEV